MRPPQCEVCGKRAIDETDSSRGDWLTFADYPADEAERGLSTPGIAYFCAEHTSAAKQLSKSKLDEAISELRARYPSAVDKHRYAPPNKKAWWRRFF
jgi:hypothetical protein